MRISWFLLLLMLFPLFFLASCGDEPDGEPDLRKKAVTYPSGETIVFTENRMLFQLEPRSLYYGDTFVNIYRQVTRDFRLVDLLNDWFFSSTNKYSNGRYFCLEPRTAWMVQRIWDLMSPEFRAAIPVRAESNRSALVSETYRDPVYNDYVDGVEDSHHKTGCAIDFRLPAGDFEAKRMFGHFQGIVDSLPEYRKEAGLFYVEEYLPENAHFHFQIGDWLDRYRIRQLVEYRKKPGATNTNLFVEPPLPAAVVYEPNTFCHLRSRYGVEVSGKLLLAGAQLTVSNWRIVPDSNGYFMTNFPLGSKVRKLTFVVSTNGKPVDRFDRPLVQPVIVPTNYYKK